MLSVIALYTEIYRWAPVECDPHFENVGAFCSDCIPNDKSLWFKTIMKYLDSISSNCEVLGQRETRVVPILPSIWTEEDQFSGFHFYHDRY